MIKRMLIMLVLFGVVLGGLFGFKVFVNGKIKEAMAGMANTPQTASAAKAETSDWQPAIDAVGSLRAVRGADLSLEVPGVVEEILFQSGDEVQAGQILLRLRGEDEIAKLQSLEATAQLAQITYDRDVQLFKARAISQAVVDNDEANLRNFKAQVDQQKAIVDKKTLRAPFAGRLGLRQVDLGQFLSAGTVIATLQSLDPIFVDFLLPQRRWRSSPSEPRSRPRSTRSPTACSPARSRPSIPRSRRRAATSRCAPRCPMPTRSCCPACSLRCSSRPAPPSA
jgi:membrane fusion protein (multidrug efflux system)